MQHLFELQASRRFYAAELVAYIFGIERNAAGPDPVVVDRRFSLLKQIIERRAADADFMEFIFGIVRELRGSEIRALLEVFLERNQQMVDFQRLSLESRGGGYVGSAVPMFQGEIDFLESLLPLVEGINLLEHRMYLEKRVQGLQRAIETEKKREFLSD